MYPKNREQPDKVIQKSVKMYPDAMVSGPEVYLPTKSNGHFWHEQGEYAEFAKLQFEHPNEILSERYRVLATMEDMKAELVKDPSLLRKVIVIRNITSGPYARPPFSEETLSHYVGHTDRMLKVQGNCLDSLTLCLQPANIVNSFRPHFSRSKRRQSRKNFPPLCSNPRSLQRRRITKWPHLECPGHSLLGSCVCSQRDPVRLRVPCLPRRTLTTCSYFSEASDNVKAWRLTEGFEGCQPGVRSELETWALVGLAGACSKPHTDHGGLSTWVLMVNGTKAWSIFEGAVDQGLMSEGCTEWVKHHTSQTIPLGPGNLL